MPRSLITRALEPLVAILWGVFFLWSLWLIAVWMFPINAAWLRLPIAVPAGGAWEASATAFSIEEPLPPNADFRRAVLLLATNADLIWLALAAVNLHLIVTSTNGLRTARAWLAFSAGGTLLIGILNHHAAIPFGPIRFGSAFGREFLDVAIGWLLLWTVLIMGARETALWLWPRASHLHISLLTGTIAFCTLLNLQRPIAYDRVWWFFDTPSTQPWWGQASWFLWPLLVAYALREKDVLSAAAPRTVKPLIILVALNFAALAANLRLTLSK